MKGRELKARDAQTREQTLIALIKMRLKHRSAATFKQGNQQVAKAAATAGVSGL